ncbi:unnamed protein product [Rotaria socialis]|uniref:F-box domain-containing protein n=1 Tax=Rotaria socialis TaxID=392032 RepID=A0A818H040_9BILA|nr:unnamed protein product [Rotaria socialis]
MILSPAKQPIFILDSLPKEIIYTIFDYFWAHDILYSFLDSSAYINSIILTYHNYHVNFKSILKRLFDLVCCSIRSNQITSLILSDDNETPCQSKIYFSLFPIEEFINLRAIRLSDIENDTLSHLWMIETIPKLKRLIVNKFSDHDYNQENSLCAISFFYLRNLTLPYCSYNQLRQILRSAPKLTSLNISLIISDCTGIDYFAEQHQEVPLIINKLTISIHTFTRTISRLLFERFLSRMPYLQQLELNVISGGSSNLLEGNQWELFIQKYLPLLFAFNFKFKIINIDRNNYHTENILTQFRSSFWLNRNPAWYVTYDINDFILYTIPRFAPHTIKHSLLSISPHSTTLPAAQYFTYYNQINELELDANEKSSYQYTNVQRLILSITKIDENILDLSKVEFLCVKSISWSLKKLLRIIKTSMIRLYHLKIDFSFSLLELSDSDSLAQIRILDLSEFIYSCKKEDYDLSTVFPYVERLTIRITSLLQMFYLIDRLMHLSSGSFHITNDSDNTKELSTESDLHKWFTEKTKRLRKNNSFTYRLDSQSDFWIHLWMSSEIERPKKVLNMNVPSGRLMELRKKNKPCLSSRCCLLL